MNKQSSIQSRKKYFFLSILFLTCLILSDSQAWNEHDIEKDEALSLIPNLDNGREVYEICSACHLPEGWGMPDGSYPQISGQHQSVLVKQLTDIRQLNRDNPSMYPFALTEEIGGAQSIADVTAYIEKLPMMINNGVGSGNELTLGKQLYTQYCITCHGINGEGNKEKFYPRIHGQHYQYLLRQFKWIKYNKRRNANPDMVKQIQSFSQKEMKAVLDYVSRLSPPKEKMKPSNWRNPDFD